MMCSLIKTKQHKNKRQQAGNNAVISGEIVHRLSPTWIIIDFIILQAHSHTCTHRRAHGHTPTPCVKCEKVVFLIQLLCVLASCCVQPCNKARTRMKEARLKIQYSRNSDDFVARLLSGI